MILFGLAATAFSLPRRKRVRSKLSSAACHPADCAVDYQLWKVDF